MLCLQGSFDSCGLAVYNNSVIGQLRWLRLPLWLMAQYFKPAKSTILFLDRIKESVVVFICHAFMSVKRNGHVDLRCSEGLQVYFAALTCLEYKISGRAIEKMFPTFESLQHKHGV